MIFLHNVHLPCFILCHLLAGFLSSVKGPFRGFHFFPDSVFLILPSLHLSRRYHGSISLAPSILWLAIPAATDLCIPACFSSTTSTRSLFALFLSWRKYSYISRTYCSSTVRLFFSTTYLHCTFVSGLSSFAFRKLLKHTWHMLVVYDSSPALLTREANCQ